MTLEEIAQYTIDYASGSFYLERSDEYDNLSEMDKQTVDELILKEVDVCGDCGWHWLIDELEQCEDGEVRCWQCVDQFYEEEE